MGMTSNVSSLTLRYGCAPPPPPTQPTPSPPSHRAGKPLTPVTCLVFSSHDGTLLVAGQDGPNPTIRVWNFRTGQCLALLGGHSNNLGTMSFSSDDTMLCAHGHDSQGRVRALCPPPFSATSLVFVDHQAVLTWLVTSGALTPVRLLPSCFRC